MGARFLAALAVLNLVFSCVMFACGFYMTAAVSLPYVGYWAALAATKGEA